MFLQILLIGSFNTSSARFIEFDAGNMISFQIKVFIKYKNRKYVTKVQLYLLLI